ncbi:hypothetical protein [Heyndrickxia acidiproducens]|uniref:hypothetical protein n=1 Tax=Heyndrickxia acidiproducens TaxID=1121084 RepID=UPI0003755A4E|nr:hypothetical protein [Heyndrickxia acidiproducens]
MNLRLNQKQMILMISLLLVCIAGAAALYWYVLAPVKTETATKKSTLKSEQQVLSSLQSREQENPDMQLATIVNLLKKVPAEPLTEQFLLDFQMAESLSDSLITETEYNQEADSDSGSSSAGQSQGTQNKQPASSETAAAALPSGIKKLTYTLTVASPDYKSMTTFLKTIENLSRITAIESIDFNQSEDTGAASSSSTASDASLKYTVTVSTFYDPQLSHYADYLPEIMVPSPSHKRDPVSGQHTRAADALQ